MMYHHDLFLSTTTGSTDGTLLHHEMRLPLEVRRLASIVYRESGWDSPSYKFVTHVVECSVYLVIITHQ